MLIPFPPYRSNLRKKRTGKRREMLLMGSSACSLFTGTVAVGGGEHISRHPSLTALVVELAAGSQGAQFQREGHQKDPKGVWANSLSFWC